MTDAYDLDRDDLLPGNATPLERAIAQTEGRLDDADMDLPRRVGSSDIAVVPARFLAHRAWGRSVDVWQPEWPEPIQRAAIVAAPIVHLFKGTPFAIRVALAALGVKTEFTEWWQTTPKGTPYTFEVRAFARVRLYDGPVLDGRTIQAIYSAVMRAKGNARFFDLTVGVGMETRLGLAPAAACVARVANVAKSNLPTPPARTDLGLAPAAAVVARLALAAGARLPTPPARSDFGLAPAAVVRARVSFTAHAG